MKEKLLIATNAVLGVAVIVLFVLHFHKTSSAEITSGQPSAASIAALPKGSIVYVNMDSLQKKYDMFADSKNQLSEKQKKLEADYANRVKNHQNSVKDYQDKAQKGLLLRSEAENIEKQLMQDEQTLMQLRETMSGQLMEEEQVMNRKIANNIHEYIKTYNSDGRFLYVMSYAFGGNLLYVPDSLDITAPVLEGLNEQYAIEHKKKQK
jgi:outer membrane protein